MTKEEYDKAKQHLEALWRAAGISYEEYQKALAALKQKHLDG